MKINNPFPNGKINPLLTNNKPIRFTEEDILEIREIILGGIKELNDEEMGKKKEKEIK